MSGKKKKRQKSQKFFSVTLRGILAGVCLALAVSGAVAFAEDVAVAVVAAAAMIVAVAEAAAVVAAETKITTLCRQ